MDAVMAVKRGDAPGAERCRRCASARVEDGAAAGHEPRRRTTPGPLRRGRRQPGPDAAVLGHAGGQGHPAGRLRGAAGRAGHVPRASGGCKAARGGDGPSYEELVETEGRPRLRYWLDRMQTEGLLEAAVVYGYFPCVVRGQRPGRARRGRATERARFTFPRQRRDRHLCLADFFRLQGVRRGRRGRASSSSRWATGSARTPRSCSPATPTATTWRCTGCRCS